MTNLVKNGELMNSVIKKEMEARMSALLVNQLEDYAQAFKEEGMTVQVKVALNPQLPWPFPSAAPKKKPEQLPAAPF
jgi:hypothetical protein